MTYTCKHCGEQVYALTICNCRGALIEHYLEELDRHGWTGLRVLTAENERLKKLLAEWLAPYDGMDADKFVPNVAAQIKETRQVLEETR